MFGYVSDEPGDLEGLGRPPSFEDLVRMGVPAMEPMRTSDTLGGGKTSPFGEPECVVDL